MHRSVLSLVLLPLFALSAFAGVTISKPLNNQSVSSPAHLVVSAPWTPSNVKAFNIYLDGVLVYNLRNQDQIDSYLWMTIGQHKITAKAWNTSGTVSSQTIDVNATSEGSLTKIQSIPGWQWCTQKLNGSVCAAGAGDATSWQAQYQTSPSLSGSSTEFALGGSTGYSNALWWKSIGGGNQVHKFRYDFWVYVDDPAVSQSLEFDLNQSFGGHRWVFGTQCDFKDTKHWDLWDSGSNMWKTSPIPCSPFAAKTWTHVVWNFERVGTQVHYISLVLNGKVIPVNIYWGYQASYPNSDINVAFQMDGDYQQDPYHVWVDKMTVTAW